jgi:hypothetical protein
MNYVWRHKSKLIIKNLEGLENYSMDSTGRWVEFLTDVPRHHPTLWERIKKLFW